jgi:predicted N-acetyltransferase YhbS
MIEIQADWALTLADETQIAGLLASSFETDFGGRSYFQQRPQTRLIWREGGAVIGHMAVMHRAIRLGDDLCNVVGLADVAVAANHRGRGIAQAILRRAIDHARGTNAVHFVLFGTAKIYPANGFAPARNDITYVDMRGARTGRVVSEPALHMRVLALQGQVWPASAAVDLLGPLF